MSDLYKKYGVCAAKAGTTMAKGTVCSAVFKQRLTTAELPTIVEPLNVAVKEYVLPSCRDAGEGAREVQQDTLREFFDFFVPAAIESLPVHPRVVRVYGVEGIEGRSAAGGGGLDRLQLTVDWVEKPATKISTPLPEAVVQSLIRDVVRGIAHLHQHGLMHNDVRPVNMILSYTLLRNGKPDDAAEADARPAVHNDRKLYAFVSDYQIFKPIQRLLDPESGNATTKQKQNYLAPEVFSGGGEYDEAKVDTWGIGCVALEWLAGKLPFYELDPTGKGQIMFKMMQSKAPPKYPEGLSDAAKAFLNACFDRDYNMRPSVADLLSLEWIK